MGSQRAHIVLPQDLIEDSFQPGLLPDDRHYRTTSRVPEECMGAERETLSLADMMVAATALEHGLALMTDNRKDFPLPELNFYPLP